MNWTRPLAVWLLIMVAESIHGIVRHLLIAPAIGDLAARQAGIVLGSAIIFAIAWVFARWIAARSLAQQFKVGLLWVVLTVLFELGLGAALGYSPERMLSDYRLTEGGFMGLGLLFMLFTPMLAASARGLGGHRSS